MEFGQIFALVWGVLAVGLGAFFVVKRDTLARIARQENERRATPSRRPALSSRLLLIGGIGFLCVGALVIVGTLIAGAR